MVHSITIRLIRHEKTRANAQRKYIGWTDEPILSPAGQYELPLNPPIVFGSDLIRCRQTAKLYFPNALYKPIEGLRELNFGEFEMKTYEELQHNELYRAWIDDPFNVTPASGESFQAFKKRVLHAFWTIVTEPGEYVFVVHGGVIRLLLSMFMKTDFAHVTANHQTIYTCEWAQIDQLKGGQRCKFISEEPIMAKENM